MRLCVGATSRIVVEEAAKLKVPQIVASRRQVDEHGGYIGMELKELVETVHDLSDGATKVIRDHGGPYQNGDHADDWVRAFDLDVEAGFDGLHLDVCKLPRPEQAVELRKLLDRYKDQGVTLEVGGERDDQAWLDILVALALDYTVPQFAVLDVGGHAWADRQQGVPRPVEWVAEMTERYNELGVMTKAHNCDWLGGRKRYEGSLDAYNVAPEFAQVEIDAWLRALPIAAVNQLLDEAYASRRWERWFGPGEGTAFERARCALRYIWIDLVPPGGNEPEETYVREVVRDALSVG
jgi:hypothetical protein